MCVQYQCQGEGNGKSKNICRASEFTLERKVFTEFGKVAELPIDAHINSYLGGAECADSLQTHGKNNPQQE